MKILSYSDESQQAIPSTFKLLQLASDMGSLGAMPCADIYGYHSYNNAIVYYHPCHGPSNQKWAYISSENITDTDEIGEQMNLGVIKSGHALSKCLQKAIDSIELSIWECNESEEQVWERIFEAEGDPEIYRNPASDKCIGFK